MRATPVLLVLGLLGGVVGGALWLAGADPIAPPAPPTEAAAAPRPGAADAAAATTAAPVATDAEDGGREPGAATDDPADALAAERDSVQLDQRRAPRVRVVRGSPALPVAEAVVYFVTEPEVQRRQARGPVPGTRWQWPAAFGQRIATDADGMATLPLADAVWLCSVTVGTDFAFGMVPPRDRVHTLELQPDERLTVRARYPDQAPGRGIPLAIVQQFGDDQAQVVHDTVTDSDGRAVVPHFQLVRQNRGGNAPERFAIVPRVPAATAVSCSGRPAATAEIEVVLPPLASVRVQLVDQRGTPLLARATVSLTAVRNVQFAPGAEIKLPPGLNVQRQEKPPGAAAVRLPFHELDVPIELSATFATLRRPLRSAATPGPTQPGTTIEVTFPLDQNQCVLAGALTVAGVPLSSQRVDMALWRADRDLLASTLDTIADGRFDSVLAPRTDAPEFWLELRLDTPRDKAAAATPSDHRRLGARVRVPALRGGQRVELGTIALAEMPALVTGLVVDDEGQPVADADVQVQVETVGEERNARDPWRGLSLLRTRTTADGRFRIDGPLPMGNLRVRADTDAHFADSVPLGRQGQDVRIKIDRNGILRGRVLLPDWIADGAMTLQLRPFDETKRERETRSIELAARRGGRFTLEPLRPGRFDAMVLMRNLAEPVAVLQDVFVQPGETRDRRFAPLDLSAALHRYRLRAVDQASQPLAIDGPILARFHKHDGAIAEAAFRWQQGRAEIVSASPLADLTFFGRGHRTVRTTLGPGDHDVMLPSLRPALLELPGARALCGPTRKVRVSVILQGDTGLPASLAGVDQRTGQNFGFARWDLGRSSGAWLGATDTVEVPLLQGGKYQVLLRPHATDSERSPQGEVALGVFELQVDANSWLPVRIPIDPITVGNALQLLDRNFATAQAAAKNGQNRPRPR